MTQSNIVILVMDTARAREITPRTAPNIMDLTTEGVRFPNAFATAPWTLPSHASMFTGTYPSKHGAHAGHKELDRRLSTLPEELKAVSYETVGISNNTWISDEFGFERGFETFYKTWQYVQSDVDLGKAAQLNEGLEMVRAITSELTRGNPLVNIVNGMYGKFLRRHNDDGARRTNEWIKKWLHSRSECRPFFLFVNYLEPHLEYHPPKRDAEQFLPDDVDFDDAMAVPQDAWRFITGELTLSEHELKTLRALYRAEIRYLDRKIGELRDTLREVGEWEDTVFVVTGDHGENIGEHGLMDHQYCLYETLIHVPLVISGGPFEGGQTVNELVQLVDLVPTLLDVADADAPVLREQAQGQSFHPNADTTPRDHVTAEYMAPQPSMEALSKRVHTLTDDVQIYDRSLRAIRTSEYKLIRGSDGSKQCYHIIEDPNEQIDISDKYPEKVAELETKLDTWLAAFEQVKTDGDVTMNIETKNRLEDLGYLQ